MSPTQIAWAAGLFEGEGCMSIQDRRNRQTGYRLSIEMTDKDIVERFQNLMGVGNITTRQRRHWKPTYTWRMNRRDEVRRILNLLLPYFGNRRAHKALDILDDLELAT